MNDSQSLILCKYRTLKNSMDVLEYGMGRDGQNNMLLPVFECCTE